MQLVSILLCASLGWAKDLNIAERLDTAVDRRRQDSTTSPGCSCDGGITKVDENQVAICGTNKIGAIGVLEGQCSSCHADYKLRNGYCYSLLCTQYSWDSTNIQDCIPNNNGKMACCFRNNANNVQGAWHGLCGTSEQLAADDTLIYTKREGRKACEDSSSSDDD